MNSSQLLKRQSLETSPLCAKTSLDFLFLILTTGGEIFDRIDFERCITAAKYELVKQTLNPRLHTYTYIYISTGGKQWMANQTINSYHLFLLVRLHANGKNLR